MLYLLKPYKECSRIFEISICSEWWSTMKLSNDQIVNRDHYNINIWFFELDWGLNKYYHEVNEINIGPLICIVALMASPVDKVVIDDFFLVSVDPLLKCRYIKYYASVLSTKRQFKRFFDCSRDRQLKTDLNELIIN